MREPRVTLQDDTLIAFSLAPDAELHGVASGAIPYISEPSDVPGAERIARMYAARLLRERAA